MKKHYSTKQKERIAQLEKDIYLILDGDIETITIYRMKRIVNRDTEKLIWSGTPTLNK